jgi:arginase
VLQFELVGVPYTSMAEPGGIARAIEVLRSAALVERLTGARAVQDAGDLVLEVGDGVRGRSGLLNESALARLVAATREAVARSQSRGRLPLLVGGDCPVMLGALEALRERHGACVLLHVDGHEDAWPPQLSPTGEASDSEVALALESGLLEPSAVAMLGPRDRADIDEGGASSLDGTVALFMDDRAVGARGPSDSAREAVAAISGPASAFWLHLDLDVLRTAEFAAVDYPQPGGLSWPELREIAAAALAAPGCGGVSIAIYNPDRDADGTGASRVVDFAAALVRAAS